MPITEIRKSLFTIGNLELVQKVEAKCEQVNTLSDPLLIQHGDIIKFSRARINKYKNPKIIFTYTSPPGDLVEHPELLEQIKKRNYSQQKRRPSQQNIRVEKNLAQSIYLSGMKLLGLKSSQQLPRQESVQITPKKQLQMSHRRYSSGPKRKMSNLSYFTKSNSKRNINPQQIQEIESVDMKLIEKKVGQGFKVNFFMTNKDSTTNKNQQITKQLKNI